MSGSLMVALSTFNRAQLSLAPSLLRLLQTQQTILLRWLQSEEVEEGAVVPTEVTGVVVATGAQTPTPMGPTIKVKIRPKTILLNHINADLNIRTYQQVLHGRALSTGNGVAKLLIVVTLLSANGSVTWFHAPQTTLTIERLASLVIQIQKLTLLTFFTVVMPEN